MTRVRPHLDTATAGADTDPLEPGAPARFAVVTDDERAPVAAGLPVVAADDYLEADALGPGTALVNLCRSHDYMSKGYYVSLVADARGQQAFPSLRDLDALGASDASRAVTSIVDAVYDTTAAPRAAGARPRIACLWDAGDELAASDAVTLSRFEAVAARRSLVFERIGVGDLPRLGEYDALFIRTVTAFDRPAFAFACEAERLGLPVIDDPRSILRASNKVYLHEAFRRHGIPAPRTRVVSERTPPEAVAALGFPLIVKLPDGTFSTAVEKAADAAELGAITARMFRRSPLLVVQEFVPTAFDWRIGVLEGRVLFACRYHMADGHWQIVKQAANGEQDYGNVEAVPMAEAPRAVLDLATASAALIGDGLYGVDIKETPAGPLVIEVNDNPNIQMECEDGAEGDRVYEAILEVFAARIRRAAAARK